MQGVKRFLYASRPRWDSSGHAMMQLSSDVTRIKVTLRIINLYDKIHGRGILQGRALAKIFGFGII